MSMKNFSDTIGNRIRDLQAYSAGLNELVDNFFISKRTFLFEKSNFEYRIVSVAMNVTALVAVVMLCLTFRYFQTVYSLFIYYRRH